MQRVYCDTCVFMDAMGFNENNHPYKDYVEFAWNFFNAVKNNEYILVTSYWVFEEFRKVTGKKQMIIDFIKDLDVDYIHVEEKANDSSEARSLSIGNYDDALHVVLAKNAKARIFTTQNMKHFAEFNEFMQKHGIQLLPPESL